MPTKSTPYFSISLKDKYKSVVVFETRTAKEDAVAIRRIAYFDESDGSNDGV